MIQPQVMEVGSFSIGNGSGNASSNAKSSATLTEDTDADGNTESSDDIAEDGARDLDAALQQFTAEQEVSHPRMNQQTVFLTPISCRVSNA